MTFSTTKKLTYQQRLDVLRERDQSNPKCELF